MLIHIKEKILQRYVTLHPGRKNNTEPKKGSGISYMDSVSVRSAI